VWVCIDRVSIIWGLGMSGPVAGADPSASRTVMCLICCSRYCCWLLLIAALACPALPCTHTAMQAQLIGPVSPSDLSDVVWALARLRFSPDESWMTHLTAAVNHHLQGFSLQGLAVVIWGYTRLGFRPDRLWLLRFRAIAGPAGQEGSSSSSGEQLAQFVAAFLAQQNRQRFAEGRPDLKGTGTAAAATARSAAAVAAARGGGRGRGRGRTVSREQQSPPPPRQQQRSQQWPS
jgi:hypothetical protein